MLLPEAVCLRYLEDDHHVAIRLRLHCGWLPSYLPAICSSQTHHLQAPVYCSLLKMVSVKLQCR